MCGLIVFDLFVIFNIPHQDGSGFNIVFNNLTVSCGFEPSQVIPKTIKKWCKLPTCLASNHEARV